MNDSILVILMHNYRFEEFFDHLLQDLLRKDLTMNQVPKNGLKNLQKGKL